MMPAKPEEQQSSKDKNNKTPSPETVKKTEEDPAVERGERLQSGKQIARGGKSEGNVPGAESAAGR